MSAILLLPDMKNVVWGMVGCNRCRLHSPPYRRDTLRFGVLYRTRQQVDLLTVLMIGHGRGVRTHRYSKIEVRKQEKFLRFFQPLVSGIGRQD